MVRGLVGSIIPARVARLAAGMFAALAVILASPVWAGKADVVDAEVVRDSDGTYRFRVTVRHQDEGWHHYANAWEVVAPNGVVLGTRVLLHPHEREQPFTRYLGKVKIPPGVDEVTIRAIDLKHGDGGMEVTVEVPK